jgi:hypothetical protein
LSRLPRKNGPTHPSGHPLPDRGDFQTLEQPCSASEMEIW